MSGFSKKNRMAVFMMGFLTLSSMPLCLPVWAGFEWVPPSEVEIDPVQTEAPVTPVSVPDPLEDVSHPMMPLLPLSQGGKAPAPVVVSEPLSAIEDKQAGNKKEPITLHRKRPPVRARNVQAALKASVLKPAKSGGGLFINPYPVQDGFSDSADNALTGMGLVEKAMMEESRVLNPVPLGMGYSTGLKPSAASPSINTINEGLPPVNLLSDEDMSITPLPGHESIPAPSGMAASLVPEKMSDQMPVVSPAASIPSISPPESFEQAIGFGRDLPLALALAQVIPPDYALAFGTSVDAGANVSWEGGKPWNEVLDDMLSPLGLRADIQSNKVMVHGV